MNKFMYAVITLLGFLVCVRIINNLYQKYDVSSVSFRMLIFSLSLVC